MSVKSLLPGAYNYTRWRKRPMYLPADELFHPRKNHSRFDEKRSNETTRIPSPPTRSNRFLYRLFRLEAGSRGTWFSCRSRFPIRAEWIGRAENKRLPWSSCLSSLVVVSPLSWLERRNSKEGKERSSDWQGAEGKTGRKGGKRNGRGGEGAESFSRNSWTWWFEVERERERKRER